MGVRKVASSFLVVTMVAAGAVIAASAASATSAASYRAYAWGYNGDGQLGNATITKSAGPATVKNLSGVTAVAAGGYHSLALLSNGTVKAWGFNKHGQLGSGSMADFSDVPATVRGLSGVIAISAGNFYSVALLSNGTVVAWGENFYGDLGDGTTTSSDIPMAVCAVGATAPCSASNGDALTGVTAISAAGFHSLALLNNGTVVAWGDNLYGDLGNGTTSKTGADVPVAVRGLSGVTAISAGGYDNLALVSNGTVKAWGSDKYGQLGNARIKDHSDVPVVVKNLRAVTAIASGGDQSLALLSNGTVMAWGYNGEGQLGDGGTGNSDVPVAVTDLSGVVTAISAGVGQSLALLRSGTVMAWGSDKDGQLGDGNTSGSSNVPVAVRGLSGVTAISAGGFHNLARAP